MPLLRWFDSGQRTLIALDLELDTSTEAGRLAALAIVGVGGWERERISERTRRGLEAARSRGGDTGPNGRRRRPRAAGPDRPHARATA